MKRLFFSSLILLCLIPARGQNYPFLSMFPTYEVLDRTPEYIEFQLDVVVVADCKVSQAHNLIYGGLYANDDGDLVEKFALQDFSNEPLRIVMDSFPNTCFRRVTYRYFARVPHEAAGYRFQTGVCCINQYMHNIDRTQGDEDFAECRIPANLPKGFIGPQLEDANIAVYPTHTAVAIEFEDYQGDFDSIKYEQTPSLFDPGARDRQPNTIPLSLYVPDSHSFKPGYTWQEPLGTQHNFQFSKDGAFQASRVFQKNFHRIPVNLIAYLDGEGYRHTRHYTLLFDSYLDPDIELQSGITDTNEVWLTFKLNRMDDFKSAVLQRTTDTSGSNPNYQNLQNISLNDTEYYDQGLQVMGNYYYRIMAVNDIDTFYSPVRHAHPTYIKPELDISRFYLEDYEVSLHWRTRDIPRQAKFRLEHLSDTGTNYEQIYFGTDTTYEHTPIASGAWHYYRISVDFGRYSLEDTLSVKTTGIRLSLNNQDAHKRITAYPNPSSGHLTIQGIEGETNYKIFDQLGQLLLEGTIKSESDRILLQGLKGGIYWLKVGRQTLRIQMR